MLSKVLKGIIPIILLVAQSAAYANASLQKAKFVLDESPTLAIALNQLNKINIADLCLVADNTLEYLKDHADDDFALSFDQSLMPFNSQARIQNTLAFICQVHQEDVALGSKSRLQNIAFLKQNFDFYRWQPDTNTAKAIAKKSTNVRKAEMLNDIPRDKLFLTKYYTKLITGSEQKTDKYNQALYALPYDEQGLNKTQALAKKSTLTRFKYTRQQILTGVLSAKELAKPLVWLTEEALHDVLLQGTGVLKVDGKTRYFNVHRNNGIAYDYAIGKRDQARYWYFAEVPSILGYGQNIESKIPIKPYVSFAGNVKQLGLGQLFLVSEAAIDKPFARLGVLADQGGAFDNNLFQLDYLVGNYRGWQDYHQANKALPDYVSTWLMLKKK